MVSSCLLESRLIVFSSSCTLVFVVNKTDLELLQFDFLSRVRIETDGHLKYLWLKFAIPIPCMLYLTLSGLHLHVTGLNNADNLLTTRCYGSVHFSIVAVELIVNVEE